jgi:uncharacterized protein (DUF488 family)
LRRYTWPVIQRVLTIGAYGFDEDTFVSALRSSGADLFVDIRARRGLRGPEHAFANANRLRATLAKAGIPYVHAKELAPTQALRDAVTAADKESGTRRRDRTALPPEFIKAYCDTCLTRFDPAEFVQRVCGDCQRPVFFCVEREPKACHRSLVADRVARRLGVPVQDLRP